MSRKKKGSSRGGGEALMITLAKLIGVILFIKLAISLMMAEW
jgi:hypothetical protein